MLYRNVANFILLSSPLQTEEEEEKEEEEKRRILSSH